MTAPILVEYAAVKDGDRWLPRVWVNGVVEDIPSPPRFAMERTATDEAQADCILVAEGYLGQGQLTIRARVEPVEGPRPLSMESTVAELSAECERLGIHAMSAEWAPLSEAWATRTIAVSNYSGDPRTKSHGLGEAIVDALAKARTEAEALRRVEDGGAR